MTKKSDNNLDKLFRHLDEFTRLAGGRNPNIIYVSVKILEELLDIPNPEKYIQIQLKNDVREVHFYNIRLYSVLNCDADYINII